jgi:hypothetical protein
MGTAVQPKNDLFLDIFNAIDFEKIVDHPNILIAARFWEPERYQAAKKCYQFMRSIDDLIDNYKSEHVSIAPDDQSRFEANVCQWINTITEASQSNTAHAELIETVRRFCIPVWPLQAFATMVSPPSNRLLNTLRELLWLRPPSLCICAV